MKTNLTPPILYGGSVSPSNARNIVEIAKFDGLLVGKASLSPEDYVNIVDACRHIEQYTEN